MHTLVCRFLVQSGCTLNVVIFGIFSSRFYPHDTVVLGANYQFINAKILANGLLHPHAEPAVMPSRAELYCWYGVLALLCGVQTPVYS
jgi:hypothetical protein